VGGLTAVAFVAGGLTSMAGPAHAGPDSPRLPAVTPVVAVAAVVHQTPVQLNCQPPQLW